MNLLYHNFQGIVYIVYKPYTIDFPGYRKNKPYTIDFPGYRKNKPYTIDFPGYRKNKPMNLLYHNFQGIVYKPYTIDFPGYRKNRPYTIDFPGYRKNKPMNLPYHMTGRVNIEKNHLWMGVSIGLLTAGVSTQDEYNHLNSGLFDRVPGFWLIANYNRFSNLDQAQALLALVNIVLLPCCIDDPNSLTFLGMGCVSMNQRLLMNCNLSVDSNQ